MTMAHKADSSLKKWSAIKYLFPATLRKLLSIKQVTNDGDIDNH